MRTSDDICLLCENQKSDKTNSHILSKFIGKKVFEGKSKRNAKSVNFEEGKVTQEKTVQDTYKEDYLLCKSCEDKLTVIETIVAKTLNPLIQKRVSSDYVSTHKDRDIEYWQLEKIDPRIFHLFVYSLLWRASISIEAYPNIKCEIANENRLKVILNKYLKEAKADLLSNLGNENSNDFSYIPIITLVPSAEPSLRTVQLQKVGEGEYYFYLPDIHIRISFRNFILDADAEEYRDIIINNSDNLIKVCVVNKDEWEKLLLYLQDLWKKGKENK